MDEYNDLLQWHADRVFDIYDVNTAGQLILDANDWVTKTCAFEKRLNGKIHTKKTDRRS